MALSGKYGKIIVEHDSKSLSLNGSDEPVFMVRARDVYGPLALVAYKQAAVSGGRGSADLERSVNEQLDAFREWQKSHPHLLKAPD